MRYFIYCVCVFAVLGCSDESEDGASPFGADNRPALDSGSAGRNTGNIDVQIVEADPVTDAGVDNNGGEPEGSAAPVCLMPPAVEDIQISQVSPCRGRSERPKIKDYRNPDCPDRIYFGPTGSNGRSENSENVELDEVVVTGVFGNDFSVQDPDGGLYSGLWVFGGTQQPSVELRPGMRLRIRGQLLEFFSLTELALDRGSDAIEVLSQNGSVPPPVMVTDPSLIADNGYLRKQLESMFVQIPNRFIISTAPDCPFDYDMFVIDGDLRIEDEVGLSYEPVRGDFVNYVRGIVHFSHGNQKVMPRSDDDISVAACNGVPEKCEIAECIVEDDAEETGNVVITEIQENPRGSDFEREFIELYNATNLTVDLSGWRLQNCADSGVDLSGEIPPGGFYVLASQRSQNENGGVRAQATLDDLQLSNNAGSVVLFNSEGALVDQVRYAHPGGDEETMWPDRQDGQSLQLTNPSADNRLGENWIATPIQDRSEYGDGGWGSPGRMIE